MQKPTPDQHASTPTGACDWRDLFGDQRQVTITLNGVAYQLRITRNEKLILTK